MTLWAGVDIGNATTEVVLCRATAPSPDASLAPSDLVASLAQIDYRTSSLGMRRGSQTTQ